MSRIDDLFRKRRSDEGCTAREEDELFRLLRVAMEPGAKRLTRDSHDRQQALWDRTPSGLHESIGSCWHAFLEEKLLYDPSWPDGIDLSPGFEVPYIVAAFTNYLNDLRPPRSPEDGRAVRFPMSRDGRNVKAVRDGLVDFANISLVILPGDPQAEYRDDTHPSSRHEVAGSDPDFHDAVHWDRSSDDAALGDAEESPELAKHYFGAASRWLTESEPWVPTLLAYLLAPQVLDGEAAPLRFSVAQIAGVSAAAITSRCHKLGLPTLNRDGTPRFARTPQHGRSLLLEWLTTHCGIADPFNEKHHAWLALRQLCLCVRSRVRSNES